METNPTATRAVANTSVSSPTQQEETCRKITIGLKNQILTRSSFDAFRFCNLHNDALFLGFSTGLSSFKVERNFFVLSDAGWQFLLWIWSRVLIRECPRLVCFEPLRSFPCFKQNVFFFTTCAHVADVLRKTLIACITTIPVISPTRLDQWSKPAQPWCDTCALFWTSTKTFFWS